MKTNAIIRIVLCSIVILILTGILLAGLELGSLLLWDSSQTVAETMVLTPYTEVTGTQDITATAVDTLHVYATPNSDSTNVVATLEKGSFVHITKQELIEQHSWGMIDSPVSGWVQMDLVRISSAAPAVTEPDPSAPTASAPSMPQEGTAAVSADQVSEISIDWASGNILVQSADVDGILFYEEGSNIRHPMVWNLKGEKLSISFREGGLSRGFGINGDHKKDLTILVPRSWVCLELEIDAASAKLEVQNLTIQSVDLDTASGKCNFVNCAIGSMDVDTASGDVNFTGTLDSLECDAASASFEAVLSNVPRSIEMDSASGDLKLTLPENAGFSVKTSALNGKFSSDFETTTQNGRYVHGDGYCRIDMEAMSGTVTIRKGQSTASVSGTAASDASCPDPSHVHSTACTQPGSTCPDPNHVHTQHCYDEKHTGPHH